MVVVVALRGDSLCEATHQRGSRNLLAGRQQHPWPASEPGSVWARGAKAGSRTSVVLSTFFSLLEPVVGGMDRLVRGLLTRRFLLSLILPV